MKGYINIYRSKSGLLYAGSVFDNAADAERFKDICQAIGSEFTKTLEFAVDDIDIESETLRRLAQGIQDYADQFLSDLESDRQQELEAAKDAAAERKGDLQRDNGRTR
jgi:hypothetical protein